MKRIRIGIAGTGKMANAHAQSFKALRGASLAACYDVDAGRSREFAERHGVARAVASFEDLLEESDAVCIVTPDRFHAGLSIRALRAGKHVLCEKPLAVTLAEARPAAREARKAEARGLIHMVNFSYRRSAALEQAARLIRAGELGDLRHLHGHYLQTWLSAPVWGHWTEDAWLWRLKSAAGSLGVLGDVGCHILDLASAAAGRIVRIRCELRTFPKTAPDGRSVRRWNGGPLDANDTAVLELELEGGALGLLHTTRWATGHKNHLRLEVHGTKGALAFDLDRSYEALDVCLGSDRDKAEWKTRVARPAPSIYQRFVRAIRTGTPAEPDFHRGAEVQAYLDACERSAETRQWEKVNRSS